MAASRARLASGTIRCRSWSPPCAAYRLPRWEGQPAYVELWVEKQALAGVLAPIAREFHATLMVNKGYSSASAMKESADRIKTANMFDKERFDEIIEEVLEVTNEYGDGSDEEKEKIHEIKDEYEKVCRKAIVLYLGDHDPSGEDMVRDIKDRLKEFGVARLTVEKIGLTIAQVRQYNRPRTRQDHRLTREGVHREVRQLLVGGRCPATAGAHAAHPLGVSEEYRRQQDGDHQGEGGDRQSSVAHGCRRHDEEANMSLRQIRLCDVETPGNGRNGPARVVCQGLYVATCPLCEVDCCKEHFTAGGTNYISVSFTVYKPSNTFTLGSQRVDVCSNCADKLIHLQGTLTHVAHEIPLIEPVRGVLVASALDKK